MTETQLLAKNIIGVLVTLLTIHFESLGDLINDVEVCIAYSNACFEVHVEGPSSTGLHEKWDGEIVESGFFWDL